MDFNLQGRCLNLQKVTDFLFQVAKQTISFGELLPMQFLFQRGNKSLGGFNPEIRGDQHLFQFLQYILVNFFFAENDTVELTDESLSRFPQTGAHITKKP